MSIDIQTQLKLQLYANFMQPQCHYVLPGRPKMGELEVRSVAIL